MCDASLHLGKQLGMEVLSEGVEDQADWDFVRHAGCDLAQGYFIVSRCTQPTCQAGWIPGRIA